MTESVGPTEPVTSPCKSNISCKRLRGGCLASLTAPSCPNGPRSVSRCGPITPVCDCATALFRNIPRPGPGQNSGLIWMAVTLPLFPFPLSLNLIVMLSLRPFTAALSPSLQARKIGSLSHGICSLVPDSPEASSRQSSFGRSSNYKDSPHSQPLHCPADRRTRTASLVS